MSTTLRSIPMRRHPTGLPQTHSSARVEKRSSGDGGVTKLTKESGVTAVYSWTRYFGKGLDLYEICL
jgi:hypothetical protein